MVEKIEKIGGNRLLDVVSRVCLCDWVFGPPANTRIQCENVAFSFSKENAALLLISKPDGSLVLQMHLFYKKAGIWFCALETDNKSLESFFNDLMTVRENAKTKKENREIEEGIRELLS